MKKPAEPERFRRAAGFLESCFKAMGRLSWEALTYALVSGPESQSISNLGDINPHIGV
jgi:hypothetical protein